ncbi:family 78 glycoside hydrolase catalytic domain [Hyunsoonleella sp. SJ7]|uniref:alpha-L-rhamnosidase n=1 Tax=Hyunsoonleella aquatilis TaxID=2762758 RepID=A0A923KM56_9FLAO|nr:family 78 glycoside hydrolase catalytic domain [Hyunsoonleella aquatilis]MBC3758675.1 family 78 glycoside hydrolase catalytic domain [Hyunsoonleella aquatilis]
MKNINVYSILLFVFGAIYLLFAQGTGALIASQIVGEIDKKHEDVKVLINWENAKWIGYTKDNRPEEWAARDLVRNQPPININTWEPTEEDLKVIRRKTHPSVLLRKSFSISKEIASAQIAVCGLGLYELYLNGKKVGDRVLDPAQTSYDKRAFYVRHDITEAIGKNNSLGLMLGNGFYGQNMAFWPGLAYGKPRAILVLNILYKDGTKEQIVTDESWKAHSSPILFDNIYLGETYDARAELSDWSTFKFDDTSWETAEIMKAPTQNLVEQDLEPMRKIRAVKPIAVWKAEKGWILDMGQNMTGWLAISVKEKEGTVVKMRFAEHLMPDKQNIDPASTGIHVTGNTQTDVYICKGDGVETWEPRFTYHAFRYVQIEGLSGTPDLSQFTGWLVRTDAERIGTFKSSDPLINKFYDVSMWTIEDNIQGLLSDCPHRERCAWMGDAYVVAEAASFNFDLKRLWQKTSSDMQTVLGVSKAHFKDPFPYDSRAPSNISVGKRLCLQARPDWGAATIMVPWFSYVYYGDKTIIEGAWDMMEGWMAYLDEKVQEDGIINGGFGDWCPPGGNPEMDTPPALTSTALYYQSLVSMGKMALVLDKKEVANSYAEKAKLLKKAFNQTFFNVEAKSYGSQTGNAFALYSGLVPEGLGQLVADNLANLIMKDKNGHYSTGIFGHRPLYTILNDYGHDAVTKHLWSITDYPSLGFMTEEHDLTVWPEGVSNWDKNERYYRHSFNHPMQSGFAASLHESLGGIRPDEDFPGFERFILRPTFLSGLQWCEVAHKSPRGKIESSWRKNNGQIEWLVSVPQTSTAMVQLPHFKAKQILLNNESVTNNTFKLKSGKHVVTINF